MEIVLMMMDVHQRVCQKRVEMAFYNLQQKHVMMAIRLVKMVVVQRVL